MIPDTAEICVLVTTAFEFIRALKATVSDNFYSFTSATITSAVRNG